MGGSKPKHGHIKQTHRSKEYVAWGHMIQRCHNEKNDAYKHYGGRGIIVCEQWRGTGGFERFFADVGEAPSKEHSLDRIDNNKGYYPENVRWATSREQGLNKRNNHLITIDGETKFITEWARQYGISCGTLYSRIKRGKSPEEALTTPLIKRKRKQSDMNKENATLSSSVDSQIEQKETLKYDLYDLTDISLDQKQEMVEGFIQLTAIHSLGLFKSLGLLTHMEATVEDAPTGEKFKFSFKRLHEEQAVQVSDTTKPSEDVNAGKITTE